MSTNDRMKMYMDYMNRENAKDNKSLGGTDMVLTEAVDVDPLELAEISQGKISRYVQGVKGELDSGKLHKGSKRWDARLRGVSRSVGKTAEGDLRRQGFGKQGLAKVGATNESLNESLDEAFMDKVRRAKYMLRKATGMQRRSVQKKAEKQAADFTKKHRNPRDRWAREHLVRSTQWRRDDKQRTESPRWALENQLKRVKSSKRKGEIQSELNSVIAQETTHKEKAGKRYQRLNAYETRTKALVDRDDSLKARARFSRTPKTVNNPMYMGQMWSNHQRKQDQ